MKNQSVEKQPYSNAGITNTPSLHNLMHGNIRNGPTYCNKFYTSSMLKLLLLATDT